jgi:hypothetical protein
MIVRKFTILLPEELDRTVRIAASAAGLPVSAWLAQAAAQVAVEHTIVADERVALKRFVTENGPITARSSLHPW